MTGFTDHVKGTAVFNVPVTSIVPYVPPTIELIPHKEAGFPSNTAVVATTALSLATIVIKSYFAAAKVIKAQIH